jgi:toxin-antitoxin system PIN domain toxin
VRLADLNLLIYAVNRDAPQHVAARRWLEDSLVGDETLGLSWTVILGFLRLTTNARVFERPLSVEDAAAFIDDWLAQPNVELVSPGNRHWSILRALLLDAGTAGNLSSDAHLAALAIEHEAELHSADADFQRFGGVRWSNPLARTDR